MPLKSLQIAFLLHWPLEQGGNSGKTVKSIQRSTNENNRKNIISNRRGEEWFEIYEDQPIAEHVEDTLNFHDGGLKEQIFIQKWWKTIVQGSYNIEVCFLREFIIWTHIDILIFF